jgi:hypothetical protein
MRHHRLQLSNISSLLAVVAAGTTLLAAAGLEDSKLLLDSP